MILSEVHKYQKSHSIFFERGRHAVRKDRWEHVEAERMVRALLHCLGYV